MLRDADLVVLGGGPAGAAAAITAATSGLRVILFERDVFPRAAPGESVHPGVQPLLLQLGVEREVLAAEFIRYPGHIVRTSSSENYFPFGEDETGPWLGFQLWRPDFDAILLSRAKAVGVMVVQPMKATGLIVDRGQVTGVTTPNGPVRARIVIDATGRRRTVALALNLTVDRHGPSRNVWYGYATSGRAEQARIPSLTIDAGGWTWIAQVRTGTIAWTRLSFNGARPPKDWMPHQLSDSMPLGPTVGADVTWEVVQHPAGPGYFLAGDAAIVLDPAAGHGLLKALMSGILAGHLAANADAANVPETVRANYYSTWIHNWFNHDVAELEARYTVFQGVSNAAIPIDATTNDFGKRAALTSESNTNQNFDSQPVSPAAASV